MQGFRNVTQRVFNTGQQAFNTGRNFTRKVSSMGMSAVRGATSAASSLASTLRSMTPPVAPFLAKMPGSETFFIDGIAEIFTKMPVSKYGEAHLIANAIIELFQKLGKPIPANLQAAFDLCSSTEITEMDKLAVKNAGLSIAAIVDGASVAALYGILTPKNEPISGGGVGYTILNTGMNIVILPYLFAFYVISFVGLGAGIVTSGAIQSFSVLKDKIFELSILDRRNEVKPADFSYQIKMAQDMYKIMMDNLNLFKAAAKGENVMDQFIMNDVKEGGTKKRRTRKHKSNKKSR
jgi:hypothetical protein